jgi:hypothetical protein
MRLVDTRHLVGRLRQALVICASLASVGFFAASASAVDCQGTLTKLSACPRDDQNNVVISTANPNCRSVYIDKPENDYGRITIEAGGEMCVRDADLNGQTILLYVKDILVKGALQVGSKEAPIGRSNRANNVRISFNGEAPKTAHDAAHSMKDDQPCPDPGFQKGLQLCQGGVLRLFGDTGTPPADSERQGAGKVSWTHLSQPAGDPCRFGPDSGAGSPVTNEGCSVWPGGRTLNLADAVDWRVDDWIVIATTSFSPFETEFARIKQIDASRKILTIEYPLVYYHFGGPDPGLPSSANYRAGRETNWGVDERAEVGLVSRNIELHGRLSGASQDYWGAETIIRAGFKEASVQGVEFAFMGKPKLGSYPVHFHQVGAIGNNQTVLFNANSIHHSYNKCITVHSTQNLVLQNNVCARAVGHLFYQEVGDEENITFQYNLGLGAMSNNFDVHAPTEFAFDGKWLPLPHALQRYQLIDRYWWPGDNLARSAENYFALNVPNHDNQLNPTHGSCRTPKADGGLEGGTEPSAQNPCPPNKYYEPASGFWIINPATKLIGNSIGGCQGAGRAYWFVPPRTAGNSGKPQLADLKFKPIGTFRNNRAHSCLAGLYGEPENDIFSEQLLPHKDGKQEEESVFNVVDGLTVTRMRDRGIWLRPSFWVVKNARLATNRDSVSLVTAGGVDGTAPGNWALLEDSVMVGISLNNVDRFGPCPYRGLTGPNSGGEFGCIDRTPFNRGVVVAGSGGDDIGRGYPDPARNFFGLMIYDGPGRYFRNRFVNFNRDISPYLTAADQAALAWYSANYWNPEAPVGQNGAGTFVYEGDAALGWFNANQSSYPNTQASEGLEFENVDLRHQIYTDRVGIDKFNDGDKNTLILDRDGSLTGMKVVGPDNKPVGNAFPASLNNLPFNASSNSVDECLATGKQNDYLEARPTSLISPSAMATLEFSALFPQAFQKEDKGKKEYRYEQILSFSKTAPDQYPPPVGTLHDPMTLHGRNGLGVWEPKVSNGYGYTVSALSKYSAPDMKPAPPGQDVGIPPSFNVGLTDAVLPADPATHEVKPFRVRLAICFTGNGKLAQPKTDYKKMFQVTRGYKAYGSPTSNGKTLEARQLWYDIPECTNLDAQNVGNLTGCPAKGKAVKVNGKDTCPDGQTPVDGVCPTKQLPAADSLASWEANEDSWYYDQKTGYLYLHLVQKVDNGLGPSSPSPTGSCDPAKVSPLPPECPNAKKAAPWSPYPENYYFCPPTGCIAYGVKLDPNEVVGGYVPSQSACPGVGHPAPASENLLVDASTGTVLQRDPRVGRPPAKPEETFPHYALKNGDEAKMCPNPGSDKQPPWGPVPPNAVQAQTFQVNFDPKYTVQIDEQNRPGVAPAMFLSAAGNLIVPLLEKGKAYRIQVLGPDKTCTTTFVPDGTRDKPHFKGPDDNRCMPSSGGGMIAAHQ